MNFLKDVKTDRYSWYKWCNQYCGATACAHHYLQIILSLVKAWGAIKKTVQDVAPWQAILSDVVQFE